MTLTVTGNGTGTVTPTLRFSDNTTASLGATTLGDWFGQTPRVFRNTELIYNNEVAKAAADLGAFYTATAERFFQCCRDAVKEADPEGLYLGCRFAWANDRAIRAAGKYCDVVSFNRYQRSVSDLRLPEGVVLRHHSREWIESLTSAFGLADPLVQLARANVSPSAACGSFPPLGTPVRVSLSPPSRR